MATTTMGTKIRRTLAAVLAALLLAFVVPSTTVAYGDIGAGAVFAGEQGHKNGRGDGVGGGKYGNSGNHNAYGKAKHA